MTLVDTGPLVGLLDKNDPYHTVCTAAAAGLPASAMLTTWPCFTEAMYLLGRAAGPSGQAALWGLLNAGLLELGEADDQDLKRMADLMHQYRDLPMDLADASLVTLAEVIGKRHLFTLDSHFRVYRLKDGTVLEIIP